jgi:hypothetical protein
MRRLPDRLRVCSPENIAESCRLTERLPNGPHRNEQLPRVLNKWNELVMQVKLSSCLSITSAITPT